LAKDAGISRVIVWEVSRFGMWSWPDDEAAEAGLTGQWGKKSDEVIISHWNWDWHNEWMFRRREFEKR
jgi:hypothetical protein